VTVRPAAAHDADALAALHVASWRAAYLDLLPGALIARRTLERRRRQWRALLEVVQQQTLVIEEGGTVVGFSNFGPARDDDLPASVAEVYAIYLHPKVWRRGFGRALWRETSQRLRGRDYREVAVWLLEGNARAWGFYRSRGLEPDGWRRTELDEGWPFEQIRLRGPLEGPP
jgi:ribosomal protein S18 acetylase RimI-like enzyme